MRRSTALVKMVAALMLVLGPAACAGDDSVSEEELLDELSESLQSGGDGFDEEQADCYAEILIEDIGVEALQDVDLQADEPPEELQPEMAAATLRAAGECGLAGEE